MAFMNKLREFLDFRDMRPADLSKVTGISEAVISNYLSGRREPMGKMCNSIAAALNVSIDELLESSFAEHEKEKRLQKLSPSAHRIGRAYDRATPPVKRTVDVALEPYIDEQVIYVEFSQSEQKASAGTGVFLSDESMVTLNVRLDALPDGYERHPENYFGVPVSGDSMEPKYHDGDILIVSKEPLNMGDIGIVIMDGEGYVKKIGSGALCSLNPEYDDIPVTESVSFCGKVVGTLDPEWIER